MNVRDYVRIKNEAGWCCIGKIVNINEFREPDMKYCIDIQGEDYIFVPEDMIAKSNPDITDLIEVGDVIRFIYDGVEYICNVEEELTVNLEDDMIYIKETNDKFKLISIITHEQFSQMEYKVGDQFER